MTIRQVDVRTGKVTVRNEDAPSFRVPPNAHDVKAEAQRRINEIAPLWKQLNMLAQSVEFLDKGRANLSTAEKLEVAKNEAAWAKIKLIRVASDKLEAMDPIPMDYTEDKYWQISQVNRR